jgi:hypothetical protein
VFILPSYSLVPSLTYKVQVDVVGVITSARSSSQSSTTGSSASIFAVVAKGNIVARISGGDSRSVSVGEVVTLDAADSYDEDMADDVVWTATGLHFTWSCMQMLPIYTATCSEISILRNVTLIGPIIQFIPSGNERSSYRIKEPVKRSPT